MPKLTVAAGATERIPSRLFNNLPATRKALIFQLISGDAYFGFDNSGANTGTLTAAGAADAGIEMATGTAGTVALHSGNYDFSKPVMIFSVAGCVINYQEALV